MRNSLNKGFEKAKISVSDEIIERVVEALNGIPRWFTFFGNRYASGYIDIETVKYYSTVSTLYEKIEVKNVFTLRKCGLLLMDELKRRVSEEMLTLPKGILVSFLRCSLVSCL